jgi:outer membrane protein assembly factor BamB
MHVRPFVFAAGLVVAGLAPAADWPQWRGLHRDDVSTETGLMASFPSGGPRLAWKFEDAGVGYSGVAIAGGTIYGFGSTGDREGEFVFALDEATGTQKWRTPLVNEKKLPGFLDQWGGGPRCTPTVDGDHVFVLGSQGDLACLETSGGKLVWQINLLKDLKGKLMSGWGYSESPLVDGDQVVCSPGGDEGALTALDKLTGKVRWRSTGLSAKATYASIVISEAGGVRHYVQLTKDGPAGFSPKDGKVLWHEMVADVWDVATIPTPIAHGDYVYVTADYKASCGLVKLTPDGQGGLKSKVVYVNKVMTNHHGGVVLLRGHVYGTSGNIAGHKTGNFVCQDFLTGKQVWSEKKALEPSSVIAAGDHIYCYGQATGTLACMDASPAGFKETGRFKIPQTSDKRKKEGGIWTHPVIANGKLYLRDQELLFCFDLKDGRASAK